MNENEIIGTDQQEAAPSASPKEIYEDALKALFAVIIAYNPYEMLAILSLKNLAAFDGVPKEYTQSGALMSMHIELLQALALRFKLSLYTIKKPNLKEVSDLLLAVTCSYSLRIFFDDFESEIGSRDLASMRIYTQAIRNWAYQKETMEIAELLFSPFDQDFKASFGISATDTVALLASTITWIEARVKGATNGLLFVMEAETKEEVALRYREKFKTDLLPDRFGDIDSLKNYAMTKWQGGPGVSMYLLTPKFFESMSVVFKIDAACVESLFSSLALEFGDLADFNLEYLHMGNPIWKKPFVRDGGTYFLPVPSLLVSHCLDILESLLPPAKRKSYEHRRSVVLEDQVANLFAARFGRENVYRGSIYNDEGHENDMVCLVDNCAFVVESKSGAIPPKARLGIELTLASTAKELMANSSEQAVRFAEFIKNNRKLHRFATKKSSFNKVDLTPIELVVPMGALLSPLTQAYPGWQKLLRSNLVGSVPLVCCFMLTDLQYVFHILDSDVALIHYLSRRERFERNFQYHGDEIDVLNYYLEWGFWMTEGAVSEITGYGQPEFDTYFMTRNSSIQVAKPFLKRNKIWLKLISQLDRHKPLGWLNLGCSLLDIDIDTQNQCEAKLMNLLELLGKQDKLLADSCSFVLDYGDGPLFVILMVYRSGANLDDEIKRMSAEIRATLTVSSPVAGIIIKATIDSGKISAEVQSLTV